MAVRKMVYEAGGGHALPPSVIVEALSGPGVLDYTIETKGFVRQKIKKLEVIYNIEEEGNAEDRPA
jgi:hypothetical protein